MKYTWLLFDADNTLFDFTRSARFAFEETLTFFKISNPPSLFPIYKQVNDQCWNAFEQKKITAEELRRARFELFFDAIGEYRDPLEVNEVYLKKLSGTRFLIKGALELLLNLKEKQYKLVIITNGLKEVQRPRIATAGLTHFFEIIVVSDEIGVSKPHAGFFDFAFSEMKYPEKERVMVIGDSLRSDIKGSNDYGVPSCWYNPEKQQNTTEIKPTFEIHRLEDLHKVLNHTP